MNIARRHRSATAMIIRAILAGRQCVQRGSHRRPRNAIDRDKAVIQRGLQLESVRTPAAPAIVVRVGQRIDYARGTRVSERHGAHDAGLVREKHSAASEQVWNVKLVGSACRL